MAILRKHMMFQGAADVTVIGSQTAGADGNVTNVVLPGAIPIKKGK